MHWMLKWPGGFPVFADEASGARFVDVDGKEIVDFCLGDTGAMTGHSPAATAAAIEKQAWRGITLMLPTEDAIWVGAELDWRFGLSVWQFALTATDASRFAIRLARELTARRKIVVFDWCYHGTVDEAVARSTAAPCARDAATSVRRSTSRRRRGSSSSATSTPSSVSWRRGDVAYVLIELALANVGIVHPEPRFHEDLRELRCTSTRSTAGSC